MKPLHEALAGWQPAKGGRADPLGALAARWASIVGEKVARGSYPSAIEAGTLTITARSSAWVAQLTYLEAQILSGLRAADPQCSITRIKTTVGQMRQIAPTPVRHDVQVPITPPPRSPSRDPLERFRTSVEGARRAKLAAGWKECVECGSLLPGKAPLRCVACSNARNAERERHVSRLLYEMPWLGFAGTAEQIDGLSEPEYRAIRRRLLSRWRQALNLAVKRGTLSRDGRERRIASSYLVLKSGLHPDRIAEATIRSELGDEMYTLLYATNG